MLVILHKRHSRQQFLTPSTLISSSPLFGSYLAHDDKSSEPTAYSKSLSSITFTSFISSSFSFFFFYLSPYPICPWNSPISLSSPPFTYEVSKKKHRFATFNRPNTQQKMSLNVVSFSISEMLKNIVVVARQF